VSGETTGRDGFADELLDELLPDELDWRRLVTTYPVTSLALAAVGGYLLGRSRGVAIVGALATFAATTVARNVNALIGEEVL
jgi:hypothetical protein